MEVLELSRGVMENHETQPRYLTVNEVADRWRLTTRTVKQYIYDGKLAVLRLGTRGDLRIALAEVERYEKENLSTIV